MSNPSPEIVASAKAALAEQLAKPERANWCYEQREAFAIAFFKSYFAAVDKAFAEAHAKGADTERQRWADILTHPAAATNYDELRELAGTGISLNDARPILDGLQISAGLTGRA